MIVKICGLTAPEEAEWVSRSGADIAGFVLFFPKSKRNITIGRAQEIMKRLDARVATAAVTVAPGAAEIEDVAAAGFDYIQIHGAVSDDDIRLAASRGLRVLKAFNVSDMAEYERFHSMPEIAGYVFDAQTPGSGRTFDWSLAARVPRDDKLLILAGGLDASNVSDAVAALQPDGVDVSSGVEYPGEVFRGKDPERIAAFIQNARQHR